MARKKTEPTLKEQALYLYQQLMIARAVGADDRAIAEKLDEVAKQMLKENENAKTGELALRLLQRGD